MTVYSIATNRQKKSRTKYFIKIIKALWHEVAEDLTHNTVYVYVGICKTLKWSVEIVSSNLYSLSRFCRRLNCAVRAIKAKIDKMCN